MPTEISIDDVVGAERVLTPAALEFVADLHRRFEPARREILSRRMNRGPLGLLPETEEVRDADWQVAPAPADLVDRRVEITGPVDRKMVINALNSGAKAYMADFEDATSPTWQNLVEGQANLIDATRGTISLETDAKRYELGDDLATLLIRPRGWHLVERHMTVGGEPVSGGLFDFGLYCFHNARHLVEQGSGPYCYLPKLESHREARLWNEVFEHVQAELGIDSGTIRATVLIETLPAAFEMEEILFELRDHSGGLNAGRWDYIFSIIKTLRDDPDAVLPDRAMVGMSVPFMQAYTDRLVATCHRRGAYAIGGMAAFIPSRDEERNRVAFEAVRNDKRREARQGFDGTWVAHPGLIPIALEEFDAVLDGATAQPGAVPDVGSPDALLDITVPGGVITEEGLRLDVRVGILYLTSWLRGVGAAALFDLMEDAATAEISRSQVWQWIQHGARLTDGRVVDPELVASVIQSEMPTIRDTLGDSVDRLDDAVALFTDLAFADDLAEFLTIPAYQLID